REAVWSDDGVYGFGSGSSSYGHALYSGTFPCRSPLAAVEAGDPGAGPADGEIPVARSGVPDR
ncbi:hypothetical protein ACWCPB_39760, partial [Streptomyces sp. NPDC001811]